MTKEERRKKYNNSEYRSKYTGIYGSWYAMKQRCDNPNHKQFKDYGGRGITYEPCWKTFEGFKADMHEGYRKGLTIERINTNGNYSKENCRWTTRKEQNNNKRKHIMVEHEGKKITLAQYAELSGLNFGVLRSRYYRGMPIEKVMSDKIFSRWDN